jgi:hypothetical protein
MHTRNRGAVMGPSTGQIPLEYLAVFGHNSHTDLQHTQCTRHNEKRARLQWRVRAPCARISRRTHLGGERHIARAREERLPPHALDRTSINSVWERPGFETLWRDLVAVGVVGRKAPVLTGEIDLPPPAAQRVACLVAEHSARGHRGWCRGGG